MEVKATAEEVQAAELAKGSRVAKTTCRMCAVQCGLDVYVENGKVVKVTGMAEHPFKGVICPRGEVGLIEWEYSKERLLNPLMRVEGKLREVSWDEALNFIASKLLSIREQYGPKALAVYTGSVFVGSGVVGIVGVLVAIGPIVDVRVGICGATLGTYSCCPTWIVVEVRQLAYMS